jgi:Mn2+/Fe2+ NRAMP family transporter
MININFGPSVFLGFIVSIAVLMVYFLRNVKPEITRDEDVFFATIGFLYSCILMVHGWRLDPILLFSQVLIILIALVAAWENIRLRGLLSSLLKLKNKEKL